MCSEKPRCMLGRLGIGRYLIMISFDRIGRCSYNNSERISNLFGQEDIVMSENPTSKQVISRKRFSEMVTPEEVGELYWNRGISVIQLASRYNVAQGTVYNFLRKHELLNERSKLSGQGRIVLANHSLSQRQRELVFGSLLGDGCVRYFTEGSMYPRLSEAHGPKQKGYIEWKAQELKPFICVFPKPYKSNSPSGIAYDMKSFPHPDFAEFREMFYAGGGKRVPLDLFLLTPFAIAVWFCDDGSNSYHTYSVAASFATNAFTFAGCERLAAFLRDSYSIKVSVGTKRTKKWGDYPELRVTSAGTLRLHRLIDPHIPDVMAYKKLFPRPGSSETIREAPSVEG